MRKIFFILTCVFAISAYGEEAQDPIAFSSAPNNVTEKSDQSVDTSATEATSGVPSTDTQEPASSSTPNDTPNKSDPASDTATVDPNSAVSATDTHDGTEGTPLSSKATTIKAQDIPVDDNAFREVLSTAYTNSTAVGSGEYQIKAANEDIMGANAGWGPDLSLGTGYDFQFDHDVFGQGVAPGYGNRLPNGYRQYTHRGDAHAQAQLKQNIYAGGATVANVEFAKSRALGAQAGYARGQQNTLLKAAQAHIAVVKGKAVVELHARNVEVLQKHLEVTRAKYEFGDQTIAAVAETEANLEKSRSELTNAKAELENAKAIYRKEIGKEPGDILVIPSTPTFLPNSKEEATQLALQNNPVLRQMEAKISEAKASLEGTYAGLKPKVDLTATAKRNLNYAWNENSGRNYGKDRKNLFAAGAQVTLPLDVMGANQSKIRKAKYENALQRIGSIYQRQDVLANTIKAWETYKSLEARITALQSQVKAAKIALDTYTEGYLVGTIPNQDVLKAKQEYFTAQVELIRVKLDCLTNAFALAEAIGILTPENLGLSVRIFDGQKHYEEMSRWGVSVNHEQTEYSGEPLLDLP